MEPSVSPFPASGPSTKHVICFRVLAVAICLMVAMPARGAEDASVPPPQPAPVEDAAVTSDLQALIDAGRFEEAIIALRPLLEQKRVEPNVLFFYGPASLEASRRPRPGRRRTRDPAE